MLSRRRGWRRFEVLIWEGCRRRTKILVRRWGGFARQHRELAPLDLRLCRSAGAKDGGEHQGKPGEEAPIRSAP